MDAQSFKNCHPVSEGLEYGAESACAKSSDIELGNGDNHAFGKRMCSVIVEW